MPGQDDIALVIGVDEYPSAPLATCVNDAEAIAGLLQAAGTQHSPPAFSVRTVTCGAGDPPLSRSQVLNELVDALDRARGQDFVFYYSGHGGSYDWGTELIVGEAGGTPESIGMPEVMALIQGSTVRRAAVILDTCFSGSFATDPIFGGRGSSVDIGPSVLPEDFALLAASQPHRPAMTGAHLSAFTELLVAGLAGGAADHNGKVSATRLYDFAANAFSGATQRPVFKANLNSSFVLRQVAIPLDLDVLRRLKDHFSSADDHVVLAPEDVVHFGDTPRNDEQRRFVDLVQIRDHGLIVCPDSRHLEVHAAERERVHLSTTGMHLQLLAARGRL